MKDFEAVFSLNSLKKDSSFETFLNQHCKYEENLYKTIPKVYKSL